LTYWDNIIKQKTSKRRGLVKNHIQSLLSGGELESGSQ